MGFNFFLAYPDESRSGGRRLVKNFRKIRRRYLLGWFSIDLVSVVPFDLLGLFFHSEILSRLKLIRVLRLLRLLKLARVLRASRIFRRMEANISMSYSTQGLIQFSVMLLVMGHWMCGAARARRPPRRRERARARDRL